MKKIIFSLILFSCTLVMAAGVDAILLNDNGSEQKIRFYKIQNDTVFYTITDSADVENRYKAHKFEIRQIRMTELDSLVDFSVSDFQPEDLDSIRADSAAQAKEAERQAELKKQGNATVYLESYPQGAQVYINEKLIPGIVTPVHVPKLRQGRNIIQVRRYLKDTDWWGTREVILKDNDTLKLKIKLEKPTTNLKVMSKPSLAEVFVDSERNLNTKPTMVTDTLLGGIRPGDSRKITFFKVGYQDTSIIMNIEPFVINRVEVDLKPLQNPDVIAKQNEFVKKRKHRNLGKKFLWGSIAPMIVGGVFWALAEKDYKEANTKRDLYETLAFESEQTKKLVKENKELVKSGDTKLIIGISGAALSLGFAISGVLLYF